MNQELERGGANGPATTGGVEAARRAADRNRERIDQDLDALGRQIQFRKRQLEDVAEQVGEIMKEPVRQVRSNPLAAVAVAAGAGFIVARLGKRSRRKEDKRVAEVIAEIRRREKKRRIAVLRRRAREPELRQRSGGESAVGRFLKGAVARAGVTAVAMMIKRRAKRAVPTLARR